MPTRHARGVRAARDPLVTVRVLHWYADRVGERLASVLLVVIAPSIVVEAVIRNILGMDVAGRD